MIEQQHSPRPVPLRSHLVRAEVIASIAEYEISTIRTPRWRQETGFPFHKRGKFVLYDPAEVAAWREARTRRVVDGRPDGA